MPGYVFSDKTLCAGYLVAWLYLITSNIPDFIF
jgi:hypothetical protein